MLKISILTPIYGVEKYIEQCARSLFEQSYASIEYIFVDDCTHDKSIGILQSLLKEYPGRAQQVRIIHHDRNRGVGAARQTALMAATGDYLLFADSDDMLPEDAVEKLARKAVSIHADQIDGMAQFCSHLLMRIAQGDAYIHRLLRERHEETALE